MRIRFFQFCLLISWWIAGGLPASAQPRAGVFLDPQVHADTNFARHLAKVVETTGYTAQFIDATTLTNAAALTPQTFPLLVLPQGRALPVESMEPVQRYLKVGGNLVALGLPLWDTPLFRVGDRWLSRVDYEQTLSSVQAEHPLFDFSRVDVKKWGHSTGPGGTEAKREVIQDGPTSALHLRIAKLSGWDNVASPALEKPFPAGHTLTCFRAKGSPGTKNLMVEWAERDGSRWIAIVELTPAWRQYALPAAAFKAWTPPAGRGGKGDSLKVDNAARLTVGVAVSHGAVDGSDNEYWLADVGTARNPFGSFDPLAQVTPPRLEALAPGYLFYPVAQPVEILLTSLDIPTFRPWLEPGQPLYALHPRPRGAGFDQNRPWRWEPLLEARSREGDYRGAVAALLVNEAGGTIAAFTPNEPEFYRHEPIELVLRETVARIKRGVFLLEGGAAFFTLFPNQPVRLGARVVNQSSALANASLTVRIAVTPAAAKAPPVFRAEWPVSPGLRQTVMMETNWLPTAWPIGGYVVSVELRDGTNLLDRLSHPLHVWQPQPQPHFLEARDGGFWLEGHPWKAHGMNYMPSSGIGVDGEYFEYWLGQGAYDPVVIDRDLRRIKAMNLNAVSVFVYRRSLGAQHLLDFLRRCEELGLRVNLSLRPGTPLDFRWNEMKELIEYFRLAQNDTVFAYDLAWEPSHFSQAYQEKLYLKPWREWAAKRYANLAAAKQAWSAGGDFKLEISDFNSLSVPTSPQLSKDGPWRKFVADYRRFLDDMLGPKYAEARRLVRGIDPHHAVSFRMQHAGDPTHTVNPLPYDFAGLAGAVDIWEPEAYGRIGDWERVKPGHFTAAYARLCDPAAPVVWAEMGNTVWDARRMAPSPERLEFTARYFADLYRMMTESGADGVFFWWYPGGYRSNERSDFGLINPDGTDRAVTKVIRTEGARFLAAPKPPAPNHWISVDRDRDARGLAGIYEAVQAEYWRALSAGQTPGLKWSKKPGR